MVRFKNTTVVLYHGTSTRHRRSIEKHGLIPRTDDGNYGTNNRSHPYVYLTRYYPAFFALNAIKDDELPLLIRTEINILELLPDEDFLAQVISKSKAHKSEWETFRRDNPQWDEMEALQNLAKSMDPQDYPDLAQASYEHMGNVCANEVPRNWITHMVEVPTRNIIELSHIGADTNYTACTGLLSSIVGGRYVPRLELLFQKGWDAVLEDIKQEHSRMQELLKKAGQ